MTTQTIFNAYNGCKKRLLAAGIEDAGFEARHIIRLITGFSNQQILSSYNTLLTERQQIALNEILAQREGRYPLQYIFGAWEFYGREFAVGTGVLIPRADTELLVEKGLERLKEIESPKVLDLCAGSGCIGITIALERRDSLVTMLEKYEQTFTYLQKNILKHKVQNARAVLGDVCLSHEAQNKYDMILSNPPYINAKDMKMLQPEVSYEPEMALCGGEDGLDFYKIIAKNYRSALKDGGKLGFEVGCGEARAVEQILTAEGYRDIEVIKDYNDIERVVFGTV